MTAVMMHEATHVFQMGTFGKQVERLQKQQHLADENFNDDSIQDAFGKQTAFKTSVEQEIALFFAASEAPSRRDVLRLAREARLSMRQREHRYYRGKAAYQSEAEDLWLTLEGSGQWSGFTWLQLPRSKGGGGIDHATAMQAFAKRGGSWSQRLGLAIALTVQRLDPTGWKYRLFKDGRCTLVQLLDTSLSGASTKQR